MTDRRYMSMPIICPDCRVPKSKDHFHTARRTGVLWRDRCNECAHAERQRRGGRRSRGRQGQEYVQ